MELLKKTIEHEEEKRQDNSDKKELFSKDRHPRKAAEHREEWAFIENERVRENISYQLQYLEFTVFLYNDYQIYLTVESLLCKNIMVTIGSIVESALYDLVEQAARKGNYDVGERRDFAALIKIAYDMQYFDNNMKNDIHELRKIRNLMHMTETDFQEFEAYKIDEANYYIEMLDKFRSMFA